MEGREGEWEGGRGEEGGGDGIDKRQGRGELRVERGGVFIHHTTIQSTDT